MAADTKDVFRRDQMAQIGRLTLQTQRLCSRFLMKDVAFGNPFDVVRNIFIVYAGDACQIASEFIKHVLNYH
jgi:hypothetical protein